MRGLSCTAENAATRLTGLSASNVFTTVLTRSLALVHFTAGKELTGKKNTGGHCYA